MAVALGFLIFIPENLADYDREPEDFWLGLWWVGGSALVAALCFVNAHNVRAGRMNWWLIVANAMVVASAISLLFVARDPALLPLLIPFVFGPAIALAFSGRSHRPST